MRAPRCAGSGIVPLRTLFTATSNSLPVVVVVARLLPDACRTVSENLCFFFFAKAYASVLQCQKPPRLALFSVVSCVRMIAEISPFLYAVSIAFFTLS